MTRTNTFPVPIRVLRTISGGRGGAFVVGAMFTAAYAQKAERLAASCEKYGLSYVIHEVPTVHRSISSQGTDDLAHTKPNFILHLLAVHKMPVLYLDADCEFVAEPALIDELVTTRCDFAIYNWFADADQYSDCYIATDVSPGPGEAPIKDRFYRFLGKEGSFSSKQLKCNGLVQFYANSIAARALLWRWQKTLATFHGCTDDGALTFTFNNLKRRSWLWWLLKVRWLPRSYARISWWLFTKPIINHQGLPTKSSSFKKIHDPLGRKLFYSSLTKRRKPGSLFPEDYIIDTKERVMCKFVDGRLVPIEPLKLDFWK